jgi:molecular chaperone GrpE
MHSDDENLPPPPGSEASQNVPAEPLSPEEELTRLRLELAAETDKRLRAMAEGENLKKRLMKEKDDFLKFAAEGVLADLLPVLDNLDLALQHGAKVKACSDFVVGVDMTRKLFLEKLSQHGLEAFGQEGQEFNPQEHEAVGTQPGTGLPDNRVITVMLKGYRLRGRLLRPAKVVVSKG